MGNLCIVYARKDRSVVEPPRGKTKNLQRRKQRRLSPLDTISWSLLSFTAWFVSDLVENPNCWFLLKIFTFYNLDKICILHGHVFVMVIISHTFVFVFNMKVEMIGLFQTYKHVAF